MQHLHSVTTLSKSREQKELWDESTVNPGNFLFQGPDWHCPARAKGRFKAVDLSKLFEVLSHGLQVFICGPISEGKRAVTLQHVAMFLPGQSDETCSIRPSPTFLNDIFYSAHIRESKIILCISFRSPVIFGNSFIYPCAGNQYFNAGMYVWPLAFQFY